MTTKLKSIGTKNSHFFYEHVKHNWKLTVFRKCEQCQPKLRSSWRAFCISFCIFECFDMLTDSSRKFLQRTLTLEIVHLKKRGALHFLNGCPDCDSNDEKLLKQTMKICRCKKTATSKLMM